MNRSRIENLKISSKFSNPFKVYKNTEHLLLSRELLRDQMKDLRIRQSKVPVFEKQTLIKQNREGIIRLLKNTDPKGIRPNLLTLKQIQS